MLLTDLERFRTRRVSNPPQRLQRLVVEALLPMRRRRMPAPSLSSNQFNRQPRLLNSLGSAHSDSTRKCTALSRLKCPPPHFWTRMQRSRGKVPKRSCGQMRKRLRGRPSPLPGAKFRHGRHLWRCDSPQSSFKLVWAQDEFRIQLVPLASFSAAHNLTSLSAQVGLENSAQVNSLSTIWT